jgi:hypothetical protein
MHAGLGARTGDVGMIAFGTVTGGVSAKLTGGNFWQGAVTGLFVSALNHANHKEEGDPNNTGLQTRKYHTNEKGEIDSENLNYIPKGDTELYKVAESAPLRVGELTIFSHGNSQGFVGIFNYNVNNGVSNTLFSDSLMWRNLVNGKTHNLTMVLRSCNTGSEDVYNNISRVLTKQTPGLTIYAPSSYWASNGRVQWHSKGKTYYGHFNIYQGGSLINHVNNK